MTLQESILGTLLFFCCVLTPTVLFPISLLRGFSKEDPIISNSTLSPALHTYPTDNSPMDSSALGPAHISSTSGLCISILIGLLAFFFFQLLLLQTIPCATIAKVIIIKGTYIHVTACLKTFNSPHRLQN